VPRPPASFCQKCPRARSICSQEPIRDETPEASEACAHDRYPRSHRRGILLQVGSSCLTSNATSPFNRSTSGNAVGLTDAMKIVWLERGAFCRCDAHNPLGPICTASNAAFKRRGVRQLFLASNPAASPGENTTLRQMLSFPHPAHAQRAQSTTRSAKCRPIGVEFNDDGLSKNKLSSSGSPSSAPQTDGSVTTGKDDYRNHK